MTKTGATARASEAGRVGKGEKTLTDGEAPPTGIRHLQGLFDVEQVRGIEPPCSAWEADKKPLMSMDSSDFDLYLTCTLLIFGLLPRKVKVQLVYTLALVNGIQVGVNP